MQLDSVDALLENQLRNLYDMEIRLAEALPTLARAAASDDLHMALENHAGVTRKHVERLEQVFEPLGLRASGKTCLGIKGLITEGDEIANSDGDDRFRDIAIIAACRRVEHYETAAYLCILAVAEHVNGEEVSDLLRENLQEEQDGDQDLASLQEDLLEDEDNEDEVSDEEMEDDLEDEIAEDQRF
jgi:ferritin-like metal-binding protein YciE